MILPQLQYEDFSGLREGIDFSIWLNNLIETVKEEQPELYAVISTLDTAYGQACALVITEAINNALVRSNR